VARAVVARGRADGDDDDVAAARSFLEIVEEVHATRRELALERGFETLFAIRCHADAQPLDAVRLHVIAAHLVAELGETDDAGHADVARTHDADSSRHGSVRSFRANER